MALRNLCHTRRVLSAAIDNLSSSSSPLRGAQGTCWSLQAFDQSHRKYSVFEPDGLNPEPEIPEYESLNIRLRGYDYVTLESFAKFTHNLVKNLDIENETYAVPARTSKVQTYKIFSTNIEHLYHLSMYERTVRVEDLPSTAAPLLFEILQQNTPEGVNITIKPPDDAEEEHRYVPNVMLNEMQQELQDINEEREDRKKK